MVAFTHDIAALLGPTALTSLRIACGPDATIHTATTASQLEAVVRQRGVAVVVVDPLLAREPGIVRRLADQIPVVAYADASPAVIRHILRFGAGHIVFRGESSTQFCEVLSDSLLGGSVDGLLARLAPSFGRLPHRLRTAIETAFRVSHEVRGARDLARLSGLPPRTVSRLCSAAGLASPLSVVLAGRVFHSYTRLRLGGDRVADIAQRMRCVPDALTRASRLVTGYRLRDLRHVSPQEVADTVVAFVTSRHRATPLCRCNRCGL